MVHSIGPDAVTVHAGSAGQTDTTHLSALPRFSALVGRKVVSQSGAFLGHVSDALISAEDGRIIGYTLEPNGPGGRRRFMDMALIPGFWTMSINRGRPSGRSARRRAASDELWVIGVRKDCHHRPAAGHAVLLGIHRLPFR